MSQDRIFDVRSAFGVIVLKKMLLFRSGCFVLDLHLYDLLGHVTLLGQGYWGEWPGPCTGLSLEPDIVAPQEFIYAYMCASACLYDHVHLEVPRSQEDVMFPGARVTGG